MPTDVVGPFAALGHRFSIETDKPLISWFRNAFAPMGDRSSGPVARCEVHRDVGDSWSIRVDDEEVCRRVHTHQILHRFVIDLNDRIARSASAHLVLHAGVVAGPGGTVVLPAPSASGKSTLVATATRLGYAYGADEHAAIRLVDGKVDPVPKPLGLKPGSAPRFTDLGPNDPSLGPFLRDQLFLSPADLPGGVLTEPTDVALIVLPQHRAGATVSIEPIRPATGVMALRENSFNFARHAQEALPVLAQMARSVPTIRVTYGDAPSALDAISATLREIKQE